MVTRHGGFSLIELMIVVAIIGVLAAIGIPRFVAYMHRAKTSEALVQLNKLGKNAKTYYQANTSFPQGTAGVLPGADGTACAGSNGRFAPAENAWSADPVWAQLVFQIGESNQFSYHYESAEPTIAKALAVGDLDCDTTLITYDLDLTVPNGVPAMTVRSPPASAD